MASRIDIAIFAFAAIVAESTARAQLTFAEPEFLLPGHGIVSVEAADIDNDDDPDIVALSTEGAISVFRNDGAGRFSAIETFIAPGTHLDFVVTELNDDEAPDLAIANFGNGTVSIMLNDGTGAFGVPAMFDAPGVSVCRGLAAGDLDGDGDSDLIVGDGFNSAKAVLWNNGSAGFGQAASFNAGGTCIAIALADLDGDRDLDAITVFNGVWMHLNKGNGTFAAAVTLAAGDGHTSVAIADLNEDGNADIAVSRSTSGGQNVARVFYNAGDGAAFSMAEYPISPLSRDIALADLNGDGLIDVTTSHVSSIDRVSVLLNLHDGAFSPAIEFFPGLYPQSVAIADVNGDGKNDIATANQFHNPRSVGLLINTTPITVPGDITGDGVVNVSDLLATTNAWGSCPVPPQSCPPDIAPPSSGDGVVNVLDLLMVINHWG